MERCTHCREPFYEWTATPDSMEFCVTCDAWSHPECLPPTHSRERDADAHAAIVGRFRSFLGTPEGLVYLARRVRVGAHAMVREAHRLERWLQAREPFQHYSREGGGRVRE